MPRHGQKGDNLYLRIVAAAIACIFITACVLIIFGHSFLIDNNFVEITLFVRVGFLLVFVELAASVILLAGAIIENRILVILWCIATIVVIIVQLLFILLAMTNLNPLNQFRLQFMLCGDVVASYFVVLVFAYYQKLNG